MSCPIDKAQEVRELQDQLMMQRHREQAAKAQEQLPEKGICLNCDERLLDGGRFCDDDCKMDYERRLQAKERSGRL